MIGTHTETRPRNTDNFYRKLAVGKLGESLIANWLKWRGWFVSPAYEKEINEGKGPQLFFRNGSLIVPDLFVFQNDRYKAFWVEAKHKTVFSWHRISKQWTTGIDLKHYYDYLELTKVSPWPIWLFFLHQRDCIPERQEPWPCPVGLFGRKLNDLQKVENHRHSNYGNGGMVYWGRNQLIKLASLNEVYEAKQ